MNSHKVHAVSSLFFDDIKKDIRGDMDDPARFFRGFYGRLINGNRAKRERRGLKQDFTDMGHVSPRTEIHDRIRPGTYGDVELFQLFIQIDVITGGSNIGVDFDRRGLSDAHGV